jgi:pyridoxal phosphate enzyme (YggS family)
VSIKENLAVVRERLAAAARRSGRSPDEIKIIAVTKTVEPARIAEAIAAGITDCGENRVQEALAKIAAFPQVNWHLIGHLQRNKVKDVIGKFALIHSVDSERLARELGARNTEIGTQGKVLIEVNTSGEKTKYGVTPDELIPLLQVISGFGSIQVAGLMTMAPLVPDPELARPYFARLRALSVQAEALNLPNVDLKYLSMGMSDDLEVAVEEGANLVRIGRAIFSKE